MSDSAHQKDISIVFLGSGPVAAESLRLLAQTFTIEAVITKPRPAHHHGSFPIIDLAASPELSGVEFITVSNKSDLSQTIAGRQTASREFQSQVAIVIDFGIIISQDVIDSFPLGIINSHFSLLPQWRGADPITFSILSGQSTTGVSIMKITAGLDEGPLLGFGIYELNQSETTPLLTADLIQLSYGLLRDRLASYIAGTTKTCPQSRAAEIGGYSSEPTYSRKLTKDDGILDFTKSATQLEREIRAFTGWPASRTRFGDSDVIITAAHVEPSSKPATPGSIWRESKQLGVNTADGVLVIDELKPAGKRAMPAAAFLAGYRI